MPDSNPFLVPSDLPFAFPPFDAIRHEHYRPAFDAGVAEQRAEVEAIAARPGEPTFANTVEALERSGRTLERVLRRLRQPGRLDGHRPQMQALETELAPLIAEHTDEIRLDPRLFARIDAVHARRPRRRADPGAGPGRRALPPGLRPGRRRAADEDRRPAARAQHPDHHPHHGVRQPGARRGQRPRGARDRPRPSSTASPTTSSRPPPSAAAAAGLDGYLLTAGRCRPSSRRSPR